MPKPTNRSFLSYYGGKVQMLKAILPRIPPHKLYTEVFFGSGAVFFAKEPSQAEVINDQNHQVVNFFEQVVINYKALKQKIEATLFSRASYKVAQTIWKMPQLFSPLQRAWAFFVGCNMGFAGNITGGWGYDKFGKRPKTFLNKKMRFDSMISERLKTVTVECNDALKVLELYDNPDSFHYIDPPYFNSDLGPYPGYTKEDYRKLLDFLSKAKGKFLLSSYPSDLLDEYTENNNWYCVAFEKALSASKKEMGVSKPRKVEQLIANYPIEVNATL